MVQVKRIGVKQTAKFFGVFYFLIALVFILPFSLISMVAGFGVLPKEQGPGIFAALGGLVLLFIPLFYALIGFVFVAIGAVIYNLIAGKVGGVEIELKTEEDKAAS